MIKQIILEQLLKLLEQQIPQVLYSNSKYAKLRDETTSSSKVLKTFNYGDKLQYLGQEKLGFLLVKDETGTQGWISKNLTSKRLPTKEEWAEELRNGSANATGGGTTATTGARG